MKYKQEEGILEYSDNGASFSVVCRIPYINEVAIAEENIGIAYFYSPYFQAASKFFSLKIPIGENREEYWGMLYPICLFDESNATIYDELKSFQKSMLLSAFLKFVEFTISIGKVNPRDGAEFHYSDFSASDSSYIYMISPYLTILTELLFFCIIWDFIMSKILSFRLLFINLYIKGHFLINFRKCY